MFGVWSSPPFPSVPMSVGAASSAVVGLNVSRVWPSGALTRHSRHGDSLWGQRWCFAHVTGGLVSNGAAPISIFDDFTASIAGGYVFKRDSADKTGAILLTPRYKAFRKTYLIANLLVLLLFKKAK
jgi:hypothetical protein